MTNTAWTWMIYLATNNNVSLAGEQSVAHVRAMPPNQRVRVLVQQAEPTGSVRRIIGATPEVVSDLGQIDSGSPQTLSDFIRWAATTAPAQHYALVIWSHGSGWEPDEMMRIAQRPLQPIDIKLPPPPPAVVHVPVTKEELTQRGKCDGHLVFFSSSMRRLLDYPTPPERAIAFDDGSGHSLDTIALGQVMAEATQLLGQPIDLVGMNACLMCSIEVAYQLRNSARVYVASEDSMPAQGLPFNDILTWLNAQPESDAVALSKTMVEQYCAYFRAHPSSSPSGALLAALQLNAMERLVNAVGTLAHALQVNVAQQWKAVWAAQRGAYPFDFQLYDLADFCSTLTRQPSLTPDSLAAAQAVLTALADPTFLLAADHTSANYDNLGGVSTYLMEPIRIRKISPYYADTDYAKATRWSDFLTAYYNTIP